MSPTSGSVAVRGAGLPLCDAGCLGHRTLFVPVALCAYFLSPVEPREEIHQAEVLLFRPDCLTLKAIRAHGLALDHSRGRDFDARSPQVRRAKISLHHSPLTGAGPRTYRQLPENHYTLWADVRRRLVFGINPPPAPSGILSSNWHLSGIGAVYLRPCRSSWRCPRWQRIVAGESAPDAGSLRLRALSLLSVRRFAGCATRFNTLCKKFS